jgi:hypothetical protein
MPRTHLVVLAALLVGEAQAQTPAKPTAPAAAPAPAAPATKAVARPAAPSGPSTTKAATAARKKAVRPQGNPYAIFQPPASVINSGTGPIRPTLFGPLDLKTMRRDDHVPIPPANPATVLSPTYGIPSGSSFTQDRIERIRPGLSMMPGRIPLPGGNSSTDRQDYQMTSYLNANGGLTTIMYDRQTGLSRAYNQSVSFDGNYGGPLPPGISRYTPGPAIGVTTWPYNSLSGSVSNPSVDRTGPYATGRFGDGGPGGPTGALGSINSAIPTYGGLPPTGFAPSTQPMAGMPSLSLSPPPASAGIATVP